MQLNSLTSQLLGLTPTPPGTPPSYMTPAAPKKAGMLGIDPMTWLQIAGAMALAEIRDFSPEVKIVLTQIRAEPSERGRLARALLEKSEVESLYTTPTQPVTPVPAAQPPGRASAGGARAR